MDIINWFCEILKEWQTLIAALIALYAAHRTIGAMRSQVAAESARHAELMKRKEMAARAQMPDALSEIGTYVENMGEYLCGGIQQLPGAPTVAVSTLKQVIEHIEDSASARTFELVSLFQVHRARTTDQLGNWLDHETRYDLVLLQAHVNSLFDYARNESETGPSGDLCRVDMNNALNNAFPLQYVVRNAGEFDDVQKIIDRRHQA